MEVYKLAESVIGTYQQHKALEELLNAEYPERSTPGGSCQQKTSCSLRSSELVLKTMAAEHPTSFVMSCIRKVTHCLS